MGFLSNQRFHVYGRNAEGQILAPWGSAPPLLEILTRVDGEILEATISTDGPGFNATFEPVEDAPKPRRKKKRFSDPKEPRHLPPRVKPRRSSREFKAFLDMKRRRSSSRRRQTNSTSRRVSAGFPELQKIPTDNELQ